jgi:hypothetical protein
MIKEEYEELKNDFATFEEKILQRLKVLREAIIELANEFGLIPYFYSDNSLTYRLSPTYMRADVKNLFGKLTEKYPEASYLFKRINEDKFRVTFLFYLNDGDIFTSIDYYAPMADLAFWTGSGTCRFEVSDIETKYTLQCEREGEL